MMHAWEENVRKVTPYVPGEQPRESDVIKLNTNENPYPPAPGVAERLKETEDLRLYPDSTAALLTDAIAACKGLGRENVFVGVGSDEVLALSFLTFFNGKKPILFPDITYSFYEVWAELFRIPYEKKALDEAFCLRPEDYYEENGGVIFPNPNAPTGIFMPLSGVRDILEHNRDVVVIVDEAYIDFGGESARRLLGDYENLLVVQTFSKSRSLAGMRIGYALGSPDLIRALSEVKYSFNSYTLNRPSILAGVASLEDEAYFRRVTARIVRTREWAKEALLNLGFTFPDSQANFIFAAHDRVPAGEIFAAAREKKIFVRHFPGQRTENYLRITVGTEKEMQIFLSFLENYFKK